MAVSHNRVAAWPSCITEGGTRTHTSVRTPDFESGASAIPPLRLVVSVYLDTPRRQSVRAIWRPLLRSANRVSGALARVRQVRDEIEPLTIGVQAVVDVGPLRHVVPVYPSRWRQ